uniref:IRG-type G domain-containing protein n=1 Tax=Chrysemys picta bellii TaxID=8478 RepID=A0A8C3F3T5_CHRPI
MDFRPERYLQQVNFRHYDFFVIVASERFRSSHADLAREIQRMEKKFYFVRCKVDEDLANARRAHPQAYVEENVLQRIRENARKCLRDQGTIDPQVFLLSNWNLDQYDFPLLEETLENDLPRLQRLVFLLSLPNFSPEIIEKKKSALVQARTVSAVFNPGPSIDCGVPQLIDCMSSYCKSFGLDDDSPVNFAQQLGKPVVDLRAVVRADCMTRTRGILSAIPLVGGLVEAQMTFLVTCTVLQRFLDNVAEDAQRVLIKALEAEEKK